MRQFLEATITEAERIEVDFIEEELITIIISTDFSGLEQLYNDSRESISLFS